MSISKLEEQKDELLDKIEALEDKCDTLERCAEPDGCETCEAYEQIEALSEKVEKIENQIEEILQSEEKD